MSYEKDVKITFYNMEDGEEVSDEYSEFLMINRDGEVFELVHNGRGDYSPSYEGDWVGYKMESRAKSDKYENNKYRTHVNDRKAEAFDAIMREWEDEKMTKSHILETIQEYYDEYESGEYDAKK